MRGLVRSILPSFLLQWYRQRKKDRRNEELNELREKGEVLTQNELKRQFQSIGICSGDSLLVHASLSKIGYVENGPQTVVQALLDVVGPDGNLLMPNSPNTSFQLDYIRNLKEFDVTNDRSGLGAISEYFRNYRLRLEVHIQPNRSRAWDQMRNGLRQNILERLLLTHRRVHLRNYLKKGGKILYLGVTLDNAGTNLHTLEDAVSDFAFPVYAQEVFEVNVRFPDGRVECMQTKVHNPVQSKERRCDGLIPLFIEKEVMQRVRIGQAESLLVDAKGMLEVMLEAYNERGVTMYTPQGTK